MAARWARAALIVVAVWALVLGSVAETCRVAEGSMLPALRPGDRLLVSKLSYGLRLPFVGCLVSWGGPHPGEVVVLRSPIDGRRLVKRVAAVEGGGSS